MVQMDCVCQLNNHFVLVVGVIAKASWSLGTTHAHTPTYPTKNRKGNNKNK